MDPAASFLQQVRCLQGDKAARKACRNACTVDTCPLVLSYWGYRPSIPINAAFCAVFVVLMSIVLVQGVWTKRFKKYTTVMFIGTAMEVIGYVARIYAYTFPFSDLSFITQLTTLTLAPAFFAAAIYFSLARIVITFGEESSRIPPRLIPRIFIACDIVSLVLQAGGGALAAYYAQQEKMPDNGNYTMIGGLAFQAFTLLVFLGFSADFAIRTIKRQKRGGSGVLNEDLASRRLRRSKLFIGLLISLAVSAVLIFMRSLYRVAELAEGWKGELMTTEKYVMWLEAVPVAIAGLLLSTFHPGNCFIDTPPPIERLEMPETPPERRTIPQAYDSEKSGQYGNVIVSYDERPSHQPYQTGNYNIPAMDKPYQTGNYNTPAMDNPYQMGNYNSPAMDKSYQPGQYYAPGGDKPYQPGNYNTPETDKRWRQ